MLPLLLLLLLVGGVLAPRFASEDPVERGAFALLAALVAAPFFAVSVAWLAQVRVDVPLVLGAAVFVGSVGGVVAWRKGDLMRWAPPGREHLPVLVGAVLIAVITSLNHYDGELLLSLASWLERGEAECFYMQSFALVDELQGPANTDPVRDAWGIISVPTNVVFTAPLLPFFDDATFRVVDVLARSLLFVFLARLLGHRGLGAGASALVAGAALLNPYALGVEVLDRNVLAALLSAALLLSLRTAPTAAGLHGLLLGLTAGAGLRFLPVVFAVPVLLHHRATLRKAAPALALGFLATVAVGLPHLAEHGLHSLGETESLLGLLGLTLTELPRAPFSPFPAGVLHLLEIFSRLGLLGVGLLFAGIWLGRRDRADLLGLLVPVVVCLGVLGVQRDWLQWDKLRIPLMLLVPAALLLGEAVRGLADAERRKGAGVAVLSGVVLAAALGAGLQRVDVPPDTSAYVRHPLYATETASALTLPRRSLAPGFLPGFGRLATKAEWGRKRTSEQALRAVLFSESSASSAVPREAGWRVGGPAPAAASHGAPVTVVVDLAKLGHDPDAAVSLGSEELPWVDVTRGDLLDVYHRAARVPWQPEELNVTVLPLGAEARALGELVVELDAFAGDGAAPDGLRRVVPIHLLGRGAPAVLHAVPQVTDTARLVLRIGDGERILLRHWLIDGASGSPHRVDSWVVDIEDGQPRVRFTLGEPESYL